MSTWIRYIDVTPLGHWRWKGTESSCPDIADVHQRLFGGPRLTLTTLCGETACLHPLHAITGPPTRIQGAAA